MDNMLGVHPGILGTNRRGAREIDAEMGTEFESGFDDVTS